MATFRCAFVLADADANHVRYPLPVARLSDATRAANLSTTTSSALVQATGGGDFSAPHDGFVLIVCDGAVDVAAGSAPTASATSGIPLIADSPQFFAVRAGDKIAVIDQA